MKKVYMTECRKTRTIKLTDWLRTVNILVPLIMFGCLNYLISYGNSSTSCGAFLFAATFTGALRSDADHLPVAARLILSFFKFILESIILKFSYRTMCQICWHDVYPRLKLPMGALSAVVKRKQRWRVASIRYLCVFHV